MHTYRHTTVRAVIRTHTLNESQMRGSWNKHTFMHSHETHTHTLGQLTSFHSTISSLLSALSPAASLDYCAAGQKRGGWRAVRDREMEGGGREDDRMEGRRQK